MRFLVVIMFITQMNSIIIKTVDMFITLKIMLITQINAIIIKTVVLLKSDNINVF